MAFARLQGKKILILASQRKNGRVVQKKIYTFDTLAEAAQTVGSDIKWKLFCDTLEMQFAATFNRSKLRQNISAKLNGLDVEGTDPVNASALRIISFLKNLKPPLSPKQRHSLELVKDNLKIISKLIDKKLNLCEGDSMLAIDRNQDTEACLDQGLTHYQKGEWDKAKALFLQGLKIDPNHVDLLVHAGLIDLIHDNYSLALTYFNKAAEIGKQFTDRMIASDPEEYTKTELYRYLEFRPFFRALTNKALALMKLKKFQDAIDILKLCQTYQDLWGTYNLIGVCYLNLGDLKNADKWYREFLWSDAFYIKALIKSLKAEYEDALTYLLTGIIKNPYIAQMLIGLEKPEETRYIGIGLPDRLGASEFIHEEGHLFKSYPDFRNLIRCILEYDEIADLLLRLDMEKIKSEKDMNYRIKRSDWDLLHGNLNDEFIGQYIPELLQRLNNKNGPYWRPEKEDLLDVQVVERKQQNWLVKLENHAREFYFRPRLYREHIGDGDVLRIRVMKSWFYRKRLFVSGEIEI